MSAIATHAFQVVSDVPVKGLDQSAIGIEQIISTHRRLAKSDYPTQRYLSLVLADSVAYAIVNEIHRANFVRLGMARRIEPQAITFDKKTAIRLLRTNMPEFEPLIKKALKGNDTLLNYIAQNSSEEEVLDGRMIKKLPVGPMSSYALDLHQKYEIIHPTLKVEVLKPDEYLMYTLIKCQTFKDMSVILDLYERGDLPESRVEFLKAIENVMSRHPNRRVDGKNNTSPFKVMLTFDHYGPEESVGATLGPAEEYTIRQTGALLPFMTDTSSLPETSKKLVKLLREMDKKAERKTPTPTP